MSDPTERPAPRSSMPPDPNRAGEERSASETAGAAATSPVPAETGPATAPRVGGTKEPRVTRTSALFVATGAVLVLGILTIVFILQNLQQVRVEFLGLSGSLPLGAALLIAAIAGGTLVLLAGAARILQLRRTARRR